MFNAEALDRAETPPKCSQLGMSGDTHCKSSFQHLELLLASSQLQQFSTGPCLLQQKLECHRSPREPNSQFCFSPALAETLMPHPEPQEIWPLCYGPLHSPQPHSRRYRIALSNTLPGFFFFKDGFWFTFKLNPNPETTSFLSPFTCRHKISMWGTPWL